MEENSCNKRFCGGFSVLYNFGLNTGCSPLLAPS